MKTTLFAVAAALAFSSLSVAHADENSVRISATNKHYLTPGEFNDYANLYLLTNGQHVRFSQRSNRYFVQVDKGENVRMFAVSKDEFMTEAGTRIVFREYGDEVGISNFEKLPMAAKLPVNTTVMARR